MTLSHSCYTLLATSMSFWHTFIAKPLAKDRIEENFVRVEVLQFICRKKTINGKVWTVLDFEFEGIACTYSIDTQRPLSEPSLSIGENNQR